VGDSIGLRGPFGKPWPLEHARGRDVILIAGGIGLAPLRPVLHELIEKRSDYEKVLLLYGTRTPNDILFRDEVQGWLGRFDIDVTVTVDRAEVEWKGETGVTTHWHGGYDRRSTNRWKGHVGVIPRFIATADFDPSTATAMICGPEVMMQFSIRALHGRGVPDEEIFLSMERSMKCGLGHCGHCLYGPHFICGDGPVFSYSQIRSQFGVKEL
jgi:NAD(P)H-flavin reductase